MKKFIVILAGGEGNRLRPKTGDDCPKQFFRTSAKAKNMLEITFERLQPLRTNLGGTIITATKDKNKKHLASCIFRGSNNIAFEPESCKNTSPAIFNIICSLSKVHGESLFAFFPVDHKIDDEPYFANFLIRAARLAEKIDKLFLLGSEDTKINSQLGFIVPSRAEAVVEGADIYPVQAFVEKPTQKEVSVLQAQNPLVNMGIFVGRASIFLECFVEAAATTKRLGGEISGASFDQEILPHVLHKLLVLEYKSTWSDLGLVLEDVDAVLNANTSERSSLDEPLNDVTLPTSEGSDSETMTKI